MSAAFGIFHSDGPPVEQATLERMSAALAHRGADGAGCWCAGPVGLGHRLLHTTPESLHEHQPLVFPGADLAITADARLDNRAELLAALDLPDGRPEEISDSQLILAAYDRWGEDCTARLDGDYAFAIWDGRRRQVFCARDLFGIKPWYYACRQGAVIFASEIKGIIAAGMPAVANDAYLAGYLLALFDDPEATAYRDILRLPAGHTLTLSRDGVVKRRFWQLRAPAELRLKSDAEYAEAFRHVFGEAVRCRMRSAFPVGALLSGGLDSSSVTCMARHLLAEQGRGESLHTFSGTFDAFPSCGEQPYFGAVIAQGGVTPHLVPVDQLGPFAVYLEGQVLQDEPYVGTTHYLHWGIYQAARPHVRVLLEGHGGDSVIAHGQTYLTELAVRGRWATLLREARAFAARDNWRVRDILQEWGVKPLIPHWFRQLWRGTREGRQREARLARALVSPTLAMQQHLRERLRENRRTDVPARTLRAEQVTELSSHIYAMIFEWFNIASLSHGLDVRYPFFDRRVVEFCLALPAEQRLRDGWTRAIMRRAMEGLLPPEVQWRGGKANLAPCFYGNLHQRDHARLEQTLQAGQAALAPYVATERLWDTFQQWADGGPASQRQWEPVWFTATLAAWLLQLAERSRGDRDA